MQRQEARKVLKNQDGVQNNDYAESNARGSTFWMCIDDFCKYFYIMTISFSNKDYKQSFISDQVFSQKWGCFQFDMPHTEKDCFFSLFQLNDRFMDDVDLKGGDEYQYAE